MCINFETSVSAFIIGTTSGILLYLQGQPEKRVIGLFIVFFSMVQLFEALIYKGYDTNGTLSKLLYLNLGFQGFFFFLLFWMYSFKNAVPYLVITGIIALYFTVSLFYKTFNKAQMGTCLTWNFIHDYYSQHLLQIMYGLLFLYLFYKQDNKTIRNAGFVLLFTCIISVAAILINLQNRPSIWCLTSALAGPLFLLI
jgi:hypothetical protein